MDCHHHSPCLSGTRYRVIGVNHRSRLVRLLLTRLRAGRGQSRTRLCARLCHWFLTCRVSACLQYRLACGFYQSGGSPCRCYAGGRPVCAHRRLAGSHSIVHHGCGSSARCKSSCGLHRIPVTVHSSAKNARPSLRPGQSEGCAVFYVRRS